MSTPSRRNKRKGRKTTRRAPGVYVHCPRCGEEYRVTATIGYFYCQTCQMVFDDNPHEGGDYSDQNPGIRIERDERRKEGRNVNRNGN